MTFLIASGDLHEDGVDGALTFRNFETAVAHLDQAGGGRLYRCVEVDESALWDWSVRRPDGADPAYAYVNERAARSCMTPGCTLVRARVGVSPRVWEPVDPTTDPSA
jgi:hypothetical protein